MPKVLPEYLETRRREILDAAQSCFVRRGFHQTTMQDICDEAGLSPGAVYRYFRSKEEIIEAMCARGQEEDAATIRETMLKGETVAVLDEMMRIFLLGLEDHEHCSINIELIAEAPRNAKIMDSVRGSRGAILAAIQEFVTSAQARGDFDPGLDPEAISRVFMSMYMGLLLQEMAEPELDRQAYCDALRAMLTGGFWRGGTPEQRQQTALALRH